MASFGQLARAYIDELRGAGTAEVISLEAIEAGTNITVRTMQMWASEKRPVNPKPYNVIKIFEYLNLSPEEAARNASELLEQSKADINNKSEHKLFDGAPKASAHQPTFTKISSDRSISYFGRQTLDVIGRDDEQDILRSFLADPARFRWLQIAGVGGQGKSRLALELVLEAEAKNWKAGFLQSADITAMKGKWANWQPTEPHVLVIDYVAGREADIQEMFCALIAHADTLRLPVRMILLERQRWDHAAKIVQKDEQAQKPPERKDGLMPANCAEWFIRLSGSYDGNLPNLIETAYHHGMIELLKLEQADLVSLVRNIAEKETDKLTLSDDEITAQLKHIDGTGRPLYAYFLGQYLASHPTSKGDKLNELLDHVIQKDQGNRWKQAFGEDSYQLGHQSQSEKLAVLATMVGGLDCRDHKKNDELFKTDATTRKQAIVLADGYLGPKVGSIIPPLEPDILGERFVLYALEEGLVVEDMVQLAWRIDPDGMAGFLLRISQDFPKAPETSDMLDVAPETDEANLAYAVIASNILANFVKNDVSFPSRTVDQLESIAEQNEVTAFNLALCYDDSKGVKQDAVKAGHWYKKAAELGYPDAMFNLALCYKDGAGVDQSAGESVYWYQKAAKLGDAGAMNNLAGCFRSGEGVELDSVQAVHWYQKAAELGDFFAMFNLAVCYQNGVGIKQDAVKAVHWYQKSAVSGHGGAMVILGLLYATGTEIEQDFSLAQKWLQQALDAGQENAAEALEMVNKDIAESNKDKD